MCQCGENDCVCTAVEKWRKVVRFLEITERNNELRLDWMWNQKRPTRKARSKFKSKNPQKNGTAIGGAIYGSILVAGVGFEPTTFWLWAKRATRLLYPATFNLCSLYSNHMKKARTFFIIFEKLSHRGIAGAEVNKSEERSVIQKRNSAWLDRLQEGLRTEATQGSTRSQSEAKKAP